LPASAQLQGRQVHVSNDRGDRKTLTKQAPSGDPARIAILNRPICPVRHFSISALEAKQIGRFQSVYLIRPDYAAHLIGGTAQK